MAANNTGADGATMVDVNPGNNTDNTGGDDETITSNNEDSDSSHSVDGQKFKTVTIDSDASHIRHWTETIITVFLDKHYLDLLVKEQCGCPLDEASQDQTVEAEESDFPLKQTYPPTKRDNHFTII
jgi:hypothetical protein